MGKYFRETRKSPCFVPSFFLPRVDFFPVSIDAFGSSSLPQIPEGVFDGRWLDRGDIGGKDGFLFCLESGRNVSPVLCSKTIPRSMWK